MNKNLSVYLDLIRFTAAALVFISHIPQFIGGYLWQISSLGHEAVVLFFVLSGYVIAYVCVEKKETKFEYIVNRAVRIYSVAIPSIILTLICYYLVVTVNPQSIESLIPTFSSTWHTLFSALTFTNQSWVSTRIFLNLPYWSMGYEVMYYVFFCFLFYFSGWKRLTLCVASVLLMGPSVLIYLPIWLLGVVGFLLRDRIIISLPFSFLCFLLSIAGFAIGSSSSTQQYLNSLGGIVPLLVEQGVILETAKNVISDYFLAGCFILNIISVNCAFRDRGINFSSGFYRNVQKLSAHTFALYLLHMPLLYLSNALLPFEYFKIYSLLSIFILIPLVIFCISLYIESNRRYLANYISIKVKNLTWIKNKPLSPLY